MIINFIGDLHGAYTKYDRFIKSLPENEYSFQVGDFGFSYKAIQQFDLNKHVMISGNHDNYDVVVDCPNYLGDFGVWNNIFYVRGAWSIDKKYRLVGVDWWEDEELSQSLLERVIGVYSIRKPDFVVTHEAPLSLVDKLVDGEIAKSYGFDNSVIKTRTNQALQKMLEIHKPKRWICGHYHRFVDINKDGFHFTCLNMVPEKGSVLKVEI